MFELSPTLGNHVTQLTLYETHERFKLVGYYIILYPGKPILLYPGTYWLSVRNEYAFTTGRWCYLETKLNLGSDLYAVWTYPKQSWYYTQYGLPTGSSALDIFGYSQ